MTAEMPLVWWSIGLVTAGVALIAFASITAGREHKKEEK